MVKWRGCGGLSPATHFLETAVRMSACLWSRSGDSGVFLTPSLRTPNHVRAGTLLRLLK